MSTQSPTHTHNLLLQGSAPEPYARAIEYGLPLIPFYSRYSQLYSQEAAAMQPLATSNVATLTSYYYCIIIISTVLLLYR